MAFSVPTGKPGVLTTYTATPRDVFYSGKEAAIFVPGPPTVDGTNSGNPLNTPYVWLLQAGMLMGRITATGKWASSVLGVTTAAYTSGGTTLTVSAATAVELVRRIGSSGSATVKVVGPPTAAGTVAVTSMTYSAVDTTTGEITCTSLGADKVSGSLIMPADGSETIKSILCDAYGVQVVDQLHTSRVDVYTAQLWAGGGIINTGMILNYPSDASLKTWVKTQLRDNGVPDAKFHDDFLS